MKDGILIINKEPGYTSFDVVAKLRGILHMKKIGHTGTLDPQAAGVLPVCLGKATKLVPLLENRDKVYEAGVLLGLATDTQDLTGRVLEEKEVSVSEEDLFSCAASFLGERMQLPPMYSALKVNGKRLYELARQGQTVERRERPVTFYELQVLSVSLPRFTLRVRCSKGTYIRTLCHDIGQALGCGAAMASLLRTDVGEFSLRDALTLSEVSELAEKGRADEVILPIDAPLKELPAAGIAPGSGKGLQNGNALRTQELIPCEEKGRAPAEGAGERVRIYDADGSFKAVYSWQEEKGLWKPERMF